MCLAQMGPCLGRLPDKGPAAQADSRGVERVPATEDAVTQTGHGSALRALLSNPPHSGSCLRFGAAGTLDDI